MAHESDPGTWAAVGLAVGGFFAGIAGAFGIIKKKKPVDDSEGDKTTESTQAQIQDLRDQVRDMKNAIENLKEVQRNDAAQRQRIEEKHDQVIVKIFEGMDTMRLDVNTIKTEIRLALSQGRQ